MAAAVRTVDVVLRYVTETEGSIPATDVTVCWHTLRSLLYFGLFAKEGRKEVDTTFGGHVTPHLYENCVVLFSMVLCSSYRICVWCCKVGSGRG